MSEISNRLSVDKSTVRRILKHQIRDILDRPTFETYASPEAFRNAHRALTIEQLWNTAKTATDKAQNTSATNAASP